MEGRFMSSKLLLYTKIAKRGNALTWCALIGSPLALKRTSVLLQIGPSTNPLRKGSLETPKRNLR